MSWNPPDVAVSIVLDIAGGFLAGLALLTLQGVWKILGIWMRRKATVKVLREFFRDWESEINRTADDEAWQFVRHKEMICRMNDNLTLMRPNLSGRQWSDTAEITRRHEELIDSRHHTFTKWYPQEDPGHFVLLPNEYTEFFAQVKAIKWLKLCQAESKSKRSKGR